MQTPRVHPTACPKLPAQGDLLVSLQQTLPEWELESFLGIWQANPDAICAVCPTAELLNWHSADQWLLERCIGGSQGMQHLCAFLRGTAGGHGMIHSPLWHLTHAHLPARRLAWSWGHG